MSSTKKARRRPAATLADVGRVAGVSAMAASAVLNGARTSSRISCATSARILDAAQQLHYRPNAAARALVARRMQTIGIAVVIDSGSLNTYFLEVFNGVIEGAAIHEQNTTVFALHDWGADASRRLPKFCDGRIDGMILIAPRFDPAAPPILPDHTPFVSLHSNASLPNVINLETDEESGAYHLVRFLLERGHRRILHFSGDPGMLGAERRIRGYQRAILEAGLPFDPELVITAGFSTPAGRHAMHDWLQRHGTQDLPGAIFCANDGVAAGVLEVLAEAGIAVPDDISVAGFDDTLAARTTVPQLTTVRQPLRTMGCRAVEVLLQQIRGEHETPASELAKGIVFPTEIIIRQSVAPRRTKL